MAETAADLLADLDETGPAKSTDLLGNIGEDDGSEAWTPEEPDGIQGRVVSRSTTKSDHHDNPVPVVTIETSDGATVRIVGFRSVLSREITEKDPQPGDFFAVKYFGRKLKKNAKQGSKNNNDYYQGYRAAVQRG
jgi:hypothetical protein